MIIWVHGAFSTGRCFNYLKQFTNVPNIIFEYSESTPLIQNITRLEGIVENNPITGIVGHSLGGLMAAIVNKRHGIRGVAISSPLGGFPIGTLSPLRVMRDTAWSSPIINEIVHHNYGDDFLSICSHTTGNKTDGVVPLKSQLAIRGGLKKTLDCNHFEVLLEPKIGEYLSDHFA